MSRALAAFFAYLRGLEVTLGHPDWLSPALRWIFIGSGVAFVAVSGWRIRKRILTARSSYEDQASEEGQADPQLLPH